MVGAVACSSDSSSDSTKSSAARSSGAKGAVDASGAITIVAKDNVYEPAEFTGAGGQTTTLKLENKGAAIHNFQIKDQKGPDGQEYQTPLVNAGQTGTVEFTLPAGAYEFFCSVHPVEMRGKVTLS